jgi:hypothetical protein
MAILSAIRSRAAMGAARFSFFAISHAIAPRPACVAVRWRSRSGRVVGLDTELKPLPLQLGKKEAGCQANVSASPAGRGPLSPDRFQERPQVDAWQDLPRFQRLAVLIPYHEIGWP